MSNPRSSASSVSDRSLTKTPLLSEPGNSDSDRRLGVNPRPKRVIIIDSDEDEKRKQRNSHPTIYQQYLEQINLPASAATVEHLSALGLIRNGLFLNSTGSINRMWKTGYEKKPICEVVLHWERSSLIKREVDHGPFIAPLALFEIGWPRCPWPRSIKASTTDHHLIRNGLKYSLKCFDLCRTPHPRPMLISIVSTRWGIEWLLLCGILLHLYFLIKRARNEMIIVS